MFSSLTVVVVAVALASSMMVWAQCSCQYYHLEVDAMYCSDPSLTSIPDCVANNITRLSIYTPSIPLVPDTIRRFTNLERLDIGFFSNPQLSKTFLSGHGNISIFEIYETSLDYVDSDWFLYSPRITSLFLMNNKIASLAPDTFSSLPLLKIVASNNNKLTTLPASLFQGTALRYIYLGGNPWHCDCELGNFTEWAGDNFVSIGDQAFCLYPEELEGLNLKSLTQYKACQKNKLNN